MGVGEPIVISQDDADRLRDALRAERLAADALELASLQGRIALHHAKAQRVAILDELADTYDFDSTTAHEFDSVACTLTKKA